MTLADSSAAAGEAEVLNETKEAGHETTLYAEPIFQVAKFPVTNSLLTSWLTVLILILAALGIRKKIQWRPGKWQSFLELVIEKALALVDSVTNSRVLSNRILPIVLPLFLFILLNNWLGLLPGVGSIGFLGPGHVFIPALRGGTADLNTTLALALLSVISANVFGIFSVGVWHYVNKFVNIQALLEIPRLILKQPTVLIVNLVKFFVGLIEIVGEVAKVASLSLRLFGNIFAGEVLLASMAVIFAFLTPVPFIFLEIIVGLIQALIFAMLTLVYFTIAAQETEH